MERMSIVDPKSKLKKKIQDPTPKSKNPHIRLELFFPMRLQISEWDLGPAVIPQSIELFWEERTKACSLDITLE